MESSSTCPRHQIITEEIETITHAETETESIADAMPDPEKFRIINPIPTKFDKDKHNIMFNMGTISVPIHAINIMNVDYLNYRDYISSSYIRNKILPNLNEKYRALDISFIQDSFKEEDGLNNLETLLFSNKEPSKSNRYIHLSNIFEFFKGIQTPVNTNTKKIARTMLMSMIRESNITDTPGIRLYFVPFLWKGVNAVTLKRDTNPLKAVIVVAQYRFVNNKVVPNLSSDTDYLSETNETLDEIAQNIGFLIGMHESEFNSVENLRREKIQYTRYNAYSLNSEHNLENYLTKNKLGGGDAILLDNGSYVSKIFCDNIKDRSKCEEILEIIESNITKLGYKPLTDPTTTKPAKDFYDRLGFSFL